MCIVPRAIVDSHHHLWRLDAGHYPWLQEEYDAGSFILCCVWADLQEELKQHGASILRNLGRGLWDTLSNTQPVFAQWERAPQRRPIARGGDGFEIVAAPAVNRPDDARRVAASEGYLDELTWIDREAGGDAIAIGGIDRHRREDRSPSPSPRLRRR